MSARHIITIPEYFKRYINSGIDLNATNKICCPFHHEDTPSFSYSPERGTWRCFGACKKGGDVIELHRVNFKLSNRAEAKSSLFALLGIKNEVTFEYKRPEVNEDEVHKHMVYAEAVKLAKTIDDWIELDYIMSFHPMNIQRLEVFCNMRRLS